MDERQSQIKEGAGLEESRVNQEFVDFLKRFGAYGLLLFAIIIAAPRGWQFWQQSKANARDAAFSDYASATEGGFVQPALLENVLTDHEGIEDVALLARMSLADAFLNAARTGLEPGARPVNGEIDPEALLTEDEITQYLGRAGSYYEQALEMAEGDPAKSMHAAAAALGLGAVAASRADLDTATRWYERARMAADAGGLTALVALADRRTSDLDQLASFEGLPAGPVVETPPADVSDEAPVVEGPRPETPDDQDPPADDPAPESP